MKNKKIMKKKLCYGKLLAPLYISNRILINEKFRFSVIEGLSANTFFRVKNKHEDRLELSLIIFSFNRDVVYI